MAPLDFLYHFRDQLREEGIRFAITSGMACVYYGLQQNTKDSDWIIHPEDIPKLRTMLEKKQRRVPPWRISYRAIFGAPLEEDYLAAGWTSHLSIWPSAGGPEQHVDIFGKPPRVPGLGLDTDDEGFVSYQTVAMMKRTDRDKDWPIVDGLGRQMRGFGISGALEHIQHPASLKAAWSETDAEERKKATSQRPLLKRLAENDDIDEDVLQRWLFVERQVWETINQVRYSCYNKAWKEFYRTWRKEENWVWPTSENFALQHRRLKHACEIHSLPVDPFPAEMRETVFYEGLRKASLRTGETKEILKEIAPPISVMLP
jgi:hypothetical protein